MSGTATMPGGRTRATAGDLTAMFAIFAAQFGIFTALLAPALVSLAVRIAQIMPEQRNEVLGSVLAIGALCALVANPIFGALSDRTRSRFGRRRPWMVVGLVIGTGGLAVLSAASTFPGFLAGWMLTQTGFNAAVAAVAAVVSDRVPERLRGRFASALGVGMYGSFIAATGVVSLVAGNTRAMFLGPAVLAFLGVFILFLLVKDADSRQMSLPRTSVGSFVKSFWISPRRFPDFYWACGSRFFKTAAQFTLTSYQSYFFIDRFGFTPEGVASAVALATLISTGGVIVMSLISGWLSDRLGRRKAFIYVAAALVALGLSALTIETTFALTLVIIGFIGAAQGIYASVDIAVIIDVLPDRENAAKDLGIANIFGVLPQSLLPALAPVLLGIGGGDENYTAFFLAGAVFAAVGALAISFVRSVR